MEAGQAFQSECIKFPQYNTDELLHVFVRQHAHACRISDEIIHLLEGGYPDAALARWRTLYEMVINCMIIKKHGKEAAIDFIKNGIINSIDEIEEHKDTAEKIGRSTFTDKEI